MLCTYRVKKGKEDAFQAILAVHWPALRKAKLATAEAPTVYRSVDRKGRTCFVELFSWADETAADRAHVMPEVMAVWGPMGELASEMEFLDLAPVALPRARPTPTSRRTRSRAAPSRAR
jgi:quinol monooxygenase YgiN